MCVCIASDFARLNTGMIRRGVGRGGGGGRVSDTSTTRPFSWIVMDAYAVCLRVHENSIDSKKKNKKKRRAFQLSFRVYVLFYVRSRHLYNPVLRAHSVTCSTVPFPPPPPPLPSPPPPTPALTQIANFSSHDTVPVEGAERKNCLSAPFSLNSFWALCGMTRNCELSL